MASVDSASNALAGLALVVGTSSRRGPIVSAVAALGMAAIEAEDPYSAMTELCRVAGRFRAVVLSLQGLHREELPMIAAVHRLDQSVAGSTPVEVWLADLDGRALALAEAMRLGVDALLVEDGLHRISVPTGDVETPSTVAESATSPTRAAPAASQSDGRPRRVAGSPAVAESPVRPNDVGDYLNRHADDREPAIRNGRDRDRGSSADGDLSAWHEIAGGSEPARSPAGSNGIATAPPDGLRRSPVPAAVMAEASEDEFDDPSPGEPVLTAEELRALLQDQPDLP